MPFEFLQLFHIIALHFRIVEFFYRVCRWAEDILRLLASDRKRVCWFCVEKPLLENAFSGILYKGCYALREALIQMNTQKRLNYVDMVKGIAVVWIVIFHLIVPGTIKNAVTHLADSMLLAFFFYSGYFHKPGKRSIGENIRIRAKATLIPFFKYSVFFWVIGSAWLLYTKNETVTEALCCLRNFFAGCIWNRVIQGRDISFWRTSGSCSHCFLPASSFS